jgi:tetratricopeptide (TPR) repeat protein
MSARRRKQTESRGANRPLAVTGKIATIKPRRPPMSRRRQWLVRLSALFLAPLIFLTLLEAGLRLGGYGYPTSFLVGPNASGVYTSNPQFARRFIPRDLARTPEASFLTKKPAGAVRIFILGSSAAQGVPDPSFSVGRVLEAMLRERHPDMAFEVVNAAITAVNSHVAVEIARDCAAHQPDVFVVYMGNNEVVGPFGPGTVFQKWTPSRRLIRANVWLKTTRVGQLLADAVARLGSQKESPKIWQGMEMFLNNPVTADDPRMPTVYDNYRQNLTDICAIARDAGAGVVLSTVAVNLRDCPPLGSLHRSDLSPEDLAKWDSLYQAGIAIEGKQERQEAVDKYEAAARIDDRFAELQYRLGQCLAGLERYEEARGHFASARDLDALRFRADSHINATIRQVAAEQKQAGARLADAEQVFADSKLAVGGIPGEGLFYEHVHFTFDGTCLLAGALLKEVEAAVPQLAALDNGGPVPTKERCAELLALTTWDEFQMAEVMKNMTARPPFTNQLDHATRQALAERRVAEIESLARTPQARLSAKSVYEGAIEKRPDDCYVHYRLGQLAVVCQQYKVAAGHLQIVWNKMPWESSVANLLGESLHGCGRVDEAIALFRKSVQLDSSFSLGHSNLGAALTSCGQFEEAVVECQKALKINPRCAPAHYNLGVALTSCQRIDEAMNHYQQALKIDPKHVLAHVNLAILLSQRERPDDAIAHLRKALEADPGSVMARNNLGNLLLSQGRLDDAIAELEKALEVAPSYLPVHHNLAIALSQRGRTDEAIEQYEVVLRIDPTSAVAHSNLGEILCNRGQLEEAINHFQKALALRPEFPEARTGLDRALKARQLASKKQ